MVIPGFDDGVSLAQPQHSVLGFLHVRTLSRRQPTLRLPPSVPSVCSTASSSSCLREWVDQVQVRRCLRSLFPVRSGNATRQHRVANWRTGL